MLICWFADIDLNDKNGKKLKFSQSHSALCGEMLIADGGCLLLVMMRYLEIIQNGRCFHLKAPPMIILCSCREETGIPLPCTQVLGLVLSQFESSSEKCSSQDLSSVQAHKAGQSVRGLVLHVGLLGCSTAPAGLSQGYPTAMCCLTTMVILQSSMYYNTGQDFGFARHDAQ